MATNTGPALSNPFKVAKPETKKLKILFYGLQGSGKTHAALTFPDPAVIDSEGGTDFFRGKPGIQPFAAHRIHTLAELDEVLNFVQQDQGKSLQTLIIDPITIFFDDQKAVAMKGNAKNTLGYRERALINDRMKGIYSKLTNLPVHVVVTAHEAMGYSIAPNGELKKEGVKPDIDKSILYAFDFIIHMSNRTGVVEKSRGILNKDSTLPRVDWSIFEPLTIPDDTMSKENAAIFLRGWRARLTDSDVLTALGVTKLSEWTQGVKAADDRVRAWEKEQLNAPRAKPMMNGAGR